MTYSEFLASKSQVGSQAGFAPVVADDLWYFLCRCGANWFAPRPGSPCPRCGNVLISTERQPLSWEAKIGVNFKS